MILFLLVTSSIPSSSRYNYDTWQATQAATDFETFKDEDRYPLESTDAKKNNHFTFVLGFDY